MLEQKNIIWQIAIASMVFVTFLFIVLIVPFILRVESENGESWKALLGIPTESVRELIRVIQERFYLIHAIENFEEEGMMIKTVSKMYEQTKKDNSSGFRYRFKYIACMTPVIAVFIVVMLITCLVWLEAATEIIHD